MEIKIVATTGRARGEAVQVRAAKFFIGCHDNCQLKPDIPGLAGIHALIEWRGGGLHLRDFGAEGGTGVNDRVLYARETELFDGDLIQIGPMVLTLSVQPKSPHTVGHRDAPDGWPFLEGLSADTTHAESLVPPPPHAQPTPEPLTVRVVPELATMPEPEPEPVAMMAAVATAPPRPARPSAAMPAKASPLTHLTRPAHFRAISCAMVEGVLVATILPPELNEEGTVAPVRHELRTLLDDNPPGRMVIDLGNTRYLSSRAVGVILAQYQALQRHGGVLRVCRVSREVKPVLDQMRLSMLIDLYPTVEEAVRDPWD